MILFNLQGTLQTLVVFTVKDVLPPTVFKPSSLFTSVKFMSVCIALETF
jgi:hypothetical protein